MKNKRIKLLSFMLTLALVIALLPVMSLTAFAAEQTEQIPYVFTSSATGNGKSYSDVKGSGVTSWTFDTLTEEVTTKDVGIVIDDYSTKPAGTYKETVTFTAKVEGELSETLITNQRVRRYTGEHFRVTVYHPGDSDGFILTTWNDASVDSINGEIITRVELTNADDFYDVRKIRAYTPGTTITYNYNTLAIISGVNGTNLHMYAADDDDIYIGQVKVYYRVPDSSTESI